MISIFKKGIRKTVKKKFGHSMYKKKFTKNTKPNNVSSVISRSCAGYYLHYVLNLKELHVRAPVVQIPTKNLSLITTQLRKILANKLV